MRKRLVALGLAGVLSVATAACATDDPDVDVDPVDPATDVTDPLTDMTDMTDPMMDTTVPG